MIKWRRPIRHNRSVELALSSTSEHHSCWDCEHIRLGGFPNRACEIHPTQMIWSCGSENELRESDDGKTVADKCLEFRIAEEYAGMGFPYDEEKK